MESIYDEYEKNAVEINGYSKINPIRAAISKFANRDLSELFINSINTNFIEKLVPDLFLAHFGDIQNLPAVDFFEAIRCKVKINDLVKLNETGLNNLADAIAGLYRTNLEEITLQLKSNDYVLFGLRLKNISGNSKKTKLLRLQNFDYVSKKILYIYNSYKDTDSISRQQSASYVSEFGQSIIQKRLDAQERFLETFSVVDLRKRSFLTNAKGQILTLKELCSPEKKGQRKLSELFCLQKNLEKIAENLGYTFLFVTLTVPACFKPKPLNGKSSYQSGLMVKDAVNLLNECFSAFGKRKSDLLNSDKNRWIKGFSKLHNDVFGFWSKEPQADGTPHTHFLMYCDKRDVAAYEKLIRHCVKQTFQKYGYKYSSKVSVDVKKDNGKAKPSSYIFKYIMKALSIKNFEAKDGSITELDSQATDLSGKHYMLHSYRRFDTFGISKILGLWREFQRGNGDSDMATRIVKRMSEQDKTEFNQLCSLVRLNDFCGFLKLYSSGTFTVAYRKKTNGLGEKIAVAVGIKFKGRYIYTRGRFGLAPFVKEKLTSILAA